MNHNIKKSILNGNCMLLLGAGASFDSLDKRGNSILMAEGLSKELCDALDIEYEPGKLPEVYQIAKHSLGARLKSILCERFEGTKPSNDLTEIAKIPWSRIYTLNIDDSLEKAFYKESKQSISIKTTRSIWSEIDQTLSCVDIIKLNGCINKFEDGLIFSPLEYAAASNNPSEWYKQLGRDYLNYKFIFIGTKLDEPLFKQQLEYYKSCWNGQANKNDSLIITPEITTIDKLSLSSMGIHHECATLNDFANWIRKELSPAPKLMDIAEARNPGYKFISDDDDQQKLNISFVEKLLKPSFDKNHGRTREFYYGFKPTWEEISDDIPAHLDFYDKFMESINEDNILHVIHGPAGSGKSTCLMSTAKDLNMRGHTVFYLKEPISNLLHQIKNIEKLTPNKYYFVIDKVSTVIDGLIECLESTEINNAIFICGERTNVWHRRTKRQLERYNPTITLSNEITKDDAKRILEKLRLYGPWSRIEKLPEDRRVKELLRRSKKQLLIGLMELTTGYGFEKIIENDFNNLSSDDEKLFLVLIGLATIHSLEFPKDLCLSALEHMKVTTHFETLISSMHGIVHISNNQLRARHPIYMDKLFDGKVTLNIKDNAIRGLLMSLTRTQRPISRNLSRSVLMIFKYAINHNFIKNYYHGSEADILSLYKDHEKYFELDGLFYLQYGLSLRHFKRHDTALQILRNAVTSWKMKQTEHAYAQQLLICAEFKTKEEAMRNVSEAEEILLRLDSNNYNDDTDYPLVTLAEGHIKLLIKFNTTSNIKDIANDYIRMLKIRSHQNKNNRRIDDAIANIMKMITNKNRRQAVSI
ncbi:SIR2 family protein [Aeromonas schubertii]|uniref:P-loop NTPase n=1 Tax=Aeromonas schubertii TaxID=652 RepID=UPI0038B4CD35